ncbi:hypothetical protein KUTeg_003281 [Tegillarca granosa]|uniref:rRNA methyltransferase 2, mitochondrial n=1 Tax=Tegillarca granosa TaxID=220873 RepID=A0ABQ9FPM4_TEGGR|nr:hypothetical protein KUTeg_003281 [Tegillarca granosa]
MALKINKRVLLLLPDLLHSKGIKTSPCACKNKPLNIKGKKVSSQQWILRQINDPYVLKTKQENWRCRSAFKLIEIDDKYNILKPGFVVIDCGAAPGSWSQVAVQRVNADKSDSEKPTGTVISIDINPIMPIVGATIIPSCDFTAVETQKKILEKLGQRKADIVISDMAPSASGTKHLDNEIIINLCISALRFSTLVLHEGGNMLCKLWMGAEQDKLKRAMEIFFRTVKMVKPESSRSDSKEIFMLGRHFKN